VATPETNPRHQLRPPLNGAGHPQANTSSTPAGTSCAWTRSRFPRTKKLVKVGIRDTPSLADVDGAKLPGLDPLAHGRLGNFEPFGKLLNGLIPVLRHEPVPNVELDEG
jgi:hypothetical protein